MARRFGLTTGTERGTPGYDVTSPFMSGIKENIASTVPLALSAMNLKMDEEKTQALLGVRKEELARQLEKTKQDNLINQLKVALPIAYETKSQDMMSQLDPTFKAATGVNFPTKEVQAPITGPENMDMPGTLKQYVIPQTDLEKKMEILASTAGYRQDLQDKMNNFRFDLMKENNSDKRMAALARIAGGGSSGTWSYIGTDENGQPIILNNKSGEPKIATTPSGSPIKPKPTDKAKKPSLRNALTGGGDTSTVAADLEKELPAAQNAGKFATDPVTKARFQSDGTKWNVIK